MDAQEQAKTSAADPEKTSSATADGAPTGTFNEQPTSRQELKPLGTCSVDLAHLNDDEHRAHFPLSDYLDQLLALHEHLRPVLASAPKKIDPNNEKEYRDYFKLKTRLYIATDVLDSDMSIDEDKLPELVQAIIESDDLTKFASAKFLAKSSSGGLWSNITSWLGGQDALNMKIASKIRQAKAHCQVTDDATFLRKINDVVQRHLVLAQYASLAAQMAVTVHSALIEKKVPVVVKEVLHHHKRECKNTIESIAKSRQLAAFDASRKEFLCDVASELVVPDWYAFSCFPLVWHMLTYILLSSPRVHFIERVRRQQQSSYQGYNNYTNYNSYSSYSTGALRISTLRESPSSDFVHFAESYSLSGWIFSQKEASLQYTMHTILLAESDRHNLQSQPTHIPLPHILPRNAYCFALPINFQVL